LRPIDKSFSHSLPMTLFFMGLMLYLGLALSRNRAALSTMFDALVNDNVLRINYKEQTSFNRTPYYLLFFAFLINAALFMFLLVVHYQIRLGSNPLFVGFICLGISLMLFVSKLAVLRLLGSVLPIQKELKYYRFIIVFFGIGMGLVLACGNFFISYLDPAYTQTAVYTVLIILGIMFAIRIFRSFLLGVSLMSKHFLHYLLYLCAVEIAPLAIFLKFALNFKGL
jgi:hypothetical protein